MLDSLFHRSTWKIAKRELLVIAYSKGFFKTVFLGPLILVFAYLAIYSSITIGNAREVGIVLPTSLLPLKQDIEKDIKDNYPKFHLVSSYAKAITLYKTDSIDAVAYLENINEGSVEFIYERPINPKIRTEIATLFLRHKLPNKSISDIKMLISPLLEKEHEETRNVYSAGAMGICAALCYFPFLFITPRRYSLREQAEKSNRTLEVILTKVSSNEFLLGKVLGSTGANTLNFFLWFIILIATVHLTNSAHNVIESWPQTILQIVILLIIATIGQVYYITSIVLFLGRRRDSNTSYIQIIKAIIYISLISALIFKLNSYFNFPIVKYIILTVISLGGVAYSSLIGPLFLFFAVTNKNYPIDISILVVSLMLLGSIILLLIISPRLKHHACHGWMPFKLPKNSHLKRSELLEVKS